MACHATATGPVTANARARANDPATESALVMVNALVMVFGPAKASESAKAMPTVDRHDSPAISP